MNKTFLILTLMLAVNLVSAVQVNCTSNSDCSNHQICDTKLYTCVDANAGVIIKSPALCVEGDFYNDDKCINKCVNGKIAQLKCCSSYVFFDEGNRTNEYGGYYCSGTNASPENTSKQNYTPVIVASIVGVCIIIGFIVLAIILKKKKEIITQKSE